MAKITVKEKVIKTLKVNDEDYICITDIAKQKNPIEPKDVVKNWFRLKNTIEYLGLWEFLNNPNFKGVEFDPLLKEAEQKQLGWTAKRELAKINYHIHTDAIKQNLIPNTLTPAQKSFIYADEADLLNVALFDKTAKQRRDENSDLKGNIRDYATINQLICLSNLENLNSVFINKGIQQKERLVELNKIAIQQMTILEQVEERRLLK